MTAEIISIGTELLLGHVVDTHSATMARILADCGISCVRRQTVGDNLERAVEAMRDSLSRADVVIAIGGLGPTDDDLTRNAIAEVLGEDLVADPKMEEKLRKIFALRKLPWVDTIARQAEKPASGRFVDNPNGTAPGLICEKDGKVIVALPGPKSEFNPMADGPVREFLSTLEGGQVIHSRTLRICGMGESMVEEKIRPLMHQANPTVAPYAQPAEVHLRVTAKAATRELADEMINPVESQIRDALGEAIYGCNDRTLEEATLDLLKQRGETVAVAESLTGGWLGMRFTSVAGSGDSFLGGIISYDTRVKEKLLGVSKETLDAHGPVSPECATEMALGARERVGTTYGVSLTGNAGPTSDKDDKPVGLVYIGFAGPNGTKVQEVQLRGARDDIRHRSTQLALVMLRDQLLAQKTDETA